MLIKNLCRLCSIVLLIVLLLIFKPSAISAVPFEDSSWVTIGTTGDAYSLGVLGKRMNNMAIEISIMQGDEFGTAYGFDYLVFKDLSENRAFFGGIGIYRRYIYEYENTYEQVKNEITYTIGIQSRLFGAFNLGYGYHSLKGFLLQFGTGF